MIQFATQVTSGDVVTIWQTFFICAASVAAVIAVACLIYYGRETRLSHNREMATIETQALQDKLELQRLRNEELDMELEILQRGGEVPDP